MMKATFFGAALTSASATQGNDLYEKQWAAWQLKYKGYVGNGDVPNAFKENVDFVAKENADANGFYKLDLNQFADLSNDAFRVAYAGTKVPANKFGGATYLGSHGSSNGTLAASVDWTTKGAVTPVKNQGSCGSCWAFSTTGSLEGAWQIATGKLVPFSEQQLVDCDKAKDQGCKGGLMDDAFTYLEKNAMCTESSYPYKGSDGSCQKSSCTVGIPEGGVTGYKDVQPKSIDAMMSAVQLGPVSVAIDAATVVQFYFGGIIKSNLCGAQLDHGVLVVGYGTDSGTDYWKVKNSWGASWGEKGYMRLLKSKSGVGECGILSEPSYPVVKASAIVV